MFELSTIWPWLTLAALGAFHGLNPAMGWLFAVALGLQERRLRAVTAALGPIALGHTLAIAVAVLTVGLLVPILIGLRGDGISTAMAHSGHLGHMPFSSPGASETLLPALAAVGIHSVAMLGVAAIVALVVYQKLGVEVLRRAWLNLDFIWIGALTLTGGLALGLSLWPFLAG